MRSISERGRRRTVSGDLIDQIEIQQETRADDGLGGATVAWTLFATEYARVESIGGSEDGDRGGVRARAIKRFTIYRRPDLTEAMRILFDGRSYNIRDLDDPASQGMFQSIVAEQGEGD